jgi:hypothetical protein
VTRSSVRIAAPQRGQPLNSGRALSKSTPWFHLPASARVWGLQSSGDVDPDEALSLAFTFEYRSGE